MKLEITIGNQQLTFLAVFAVALAVVGIAGAYNPGGTGGNPAVMGHSVDELDWSKAIPNLYVTGNVNAQKFLVSGSTVAGINIVVNGLGKKWSINTFARSCYGYRYPPTGYFYSGQTGDGVYTIDPDGPAGNAEFDIYCDMTSDGGGWTLVAGINGVNKNHNKVAAVTPENLISSTGKGKLSDADINNINSGVGPAYRLTCNTLTAYFQSECEFVATANAKGPCTAESHSFPPTSYGDARYEQGDIDGLAEGSHGTANRDIYGSSSQNGCNNGAAWGQSGTVYVR